MINTAVIMGRLTAEPELKHTPNNVPVLSFTVAVDRKFTKDGNRDTDFIDAVAWRNQAEFISKYFRKGQMIALCGSIQTRMWEDKEGKKRKSVELIVDEVSFTGSKSETYGAAEPYSPPVLDIDAPPMSPDSDFKEISADDAELPF